MCSLTGCWCCVLARYGLQNDELLLEARKQLEDALQASREAAGASADLLNFDTFAAYERTVQSHADSTATFKANVASVLLSAKKRCLAATEARLHRIVAEGEERCVRGCGRARPRARTRVLLLCVAYGVQSGRVTRGVSCRT